MSFFVDVRNTADSPCMSNRPLASRDRVDASRSLFLLAKFPDRPLVHMDDGVYIDALIRPEHLVDCFRHVGFPVTFTGHFLVVQLAISSRRYSGNEDARRTNASLLSIHRTQDTAYQLPYQATCRNGRYMRMRQVARQLFPCDVGPWHSRTLPSTFLTRHFSCQPLYQTTCRAGRCIRIRQSSISALSAQRRP
jgi:hypothetical protein